MSDTQDSSTGEQKQLRPEEVKKGTKKNKKGAKTESKKTRSGDAPLEKKLSTKKGVTEKKVAKDKALSRDKTTSRSRANSSQTKLAAKTGTTPGLPASDKVPVDRPGATATGTDTPTRASAGPAPNDANSIAWMAVQAARMVDAVKAAQLKQAQPEQAGDEPVEEAETTRTDKKSKSGKARKAAKDGKGKKAHNHDTGGKAAPAKPTKSGQSGKKKAKEKLVAAESAPIVAAQVEPGATRPVQPQPAAPSAPKAVVVAVAPAPAGEAGTDTVPLPDIPTAAEPAQKQEDQKTESGTEATPSAQELTAAASRRPAPMRSALLLLVGLIAVAGLLGYRYWYTGGDAAMTTPTADKSRFDRASKPSTTETVRSVVSPVPMQQPQGSAQVPKATLAERRLPEVTPPVPEETAAQVPEKTAAKPASTVKQDRPATQPVVAVQNEEKVILPKVAETKENKPEPAAAIQGASRPGAPPPRFRPPAYGRYPPQPAWQRQPYYMPHYPQRPSGNSR